MRRALTPLTPEAHPPLVGVNFLSRPGGARMWSCYDEGSVRTDLRALADRGVTLTRSFILWRDLAPDLEDIDAALLNRFGNFLDLHAFLGLRTVPTLLPANRAGPGADPYSSDGPGPRVNGWLAGRQAWFAEQAARAFGGHPAIAGWLLETRLPQASPTDVHALDGWARAVMRGLRAGGATQPVCLDWIGARALRTGGGEVPDHLRTALACELAAVMDRPVVLEEFGVDGHAAPAGDPGRHFRQALHNSLLGGATGWFAWSGGAPGPGSVGGCSPPSDPGSGCAPPGATADPAALPELADFRAVLEKVAPHRCDRAATDVGLLAAPGLGSGYPVADPVPVGALEQAYLACRQAGTPPGLVPRGGDIPGDCLLYLIPSAAEVTAAECARLEELAHGGATVYLSYLGPGAGSARAPWHAGLERLFGVRRRPRHGAVHPVGPDTVLMALRDQVGNLTPGTELCFPAGLDGATRVYLPVEPVEAQVLATDGAERPVLLQRTAGAGAVILCCCPVEAMAASAPAAEDRDIWRLYAALAHAAGAYPAVRVDRPRVLVDCLDRDDGMRFVWLISQSADPLTVRPRTRSGDALHDLRTGALASTVDLPPFGVRVLRADGMGREVRVR